MKIILATTNQDKHWHFSKIFMELTDDEIKSSDGASNRMKKDLEKNLDIIKKHVR